MAYLDFSLHADKTGANMPPWHRHSVYTSMLGIVSVHQHTMLVHINVDKRKIGPLSTTTY